MATLYEKKVRIRTISVRLVLTAVIALTVYAVATQILPILFSLFFEIEMLSIDQFLIEQIESKLGPTATKIFSPLIQQYPDLALLVIAASIAFVSGKKSASTVFESYFAPYNDDVLSAITRPKPYDPLRGTLGADKADLPMPFICREGTELHRIREALNTFIRSGAASENRKPIQPFTWQAVTGPAGSGKSRLAVEVARSFGRRDIYGDQADQQAKRRRQPLREWFANIFQSTADKPIAWDSGWIKPGRFIETQSGKDEKIPYFEWTKRGAVTSAYLNALESWRPRRPTILVLDDPLLGDAKAVIDVLQSSANNYLYAVRLILVNQSQPKELGEFSNQGAWRGRGAQVPFSAPIVYP